MALPEQKHIKKYFHKTTVQGASFTSSVRENTNFLPNFKLKYM
jgi:hypothetical protein